MKLAQDFYKIEQNLRFNKGLKITESNTVGDIITTVIPYIFGAAGIVLLAYLIMGGLSLMTSTGDPKKIEAAKQKITNALIGLVIMFASFWIVQILGNILGIEVLKGLFN